jgi:hypothetical protein
MTKMGKEHCMSVGNIVVCLMAKQHGFSTNFDPEEVHKPKKMEWHKGC